MKFASERFGIRVLIILFAVGLVVISAQAQDAPSGTLYFNTLDGAVYAWDVETTAAELIVNYDIQFDGDVSGWSSVTFSNDGNSLAYIHADQSDLWVGVGKLQSWHPTEYPLNVHFDFQHVRLEWLPGDTYLVISYTRDDSETGFDTLVGRQLLELNTGNTSPTNWPYTCGSVALDTEGKGPLLYCFLDDTLTQSDEQHPQFAAFDLATMTLNYRTEDDFERQFPVQDLIHPNWDWSAEKGMVFFDDGLHALSRGFYWLPMGASEPMLLKIDVAFQGNYSWSHTGAELLIQDTDLATWYVYDVERQELITTLTISDLEFNPGVIWFDAADQVAYVTREDQQSAVTVQSLTDDTANRSLEIADLVTAIASAEQ